MPRKAFRFWEEENPEDDSLSEADLEKVLLKNKFGNFELTEGVRIISDDIIPEDGYLQHQPNESPMAQCGLCISVTRNKLWDLFVDLLETMKETNLLVVLDKTTISLNRVVRAGIDRCVLQGILDEYRDLLIDDGCVGIAVAQRRKRKLLFFDDHKLIYFLQMI